MKYILILTQDTKNKSCELIAAGLRHEGMQVLLWDLNQLKISDTSLMYGVTHSITQTVIKADEIALVIKRTWGPLRTKGLQLCREMEKLGVNVLNGCDFIAWMHSKILQYKTLATKDICPETICFEKGLVTAENILQRVNIPFPIIFKTEYGCKADGVYLILSRDQLNKFIDHHLTHTTLLQNGFLLQKFIPTHSDINISTYYRINIVDGNAQSAVQFQMQWQDDATGAKRLADFPNAKDIPVNIDIFESKQLQKLLTAVDCKSKVVGIDVTYVDGKMSLLEYNDGPIVSSIVELGEKYPKLPGSKDCAAFAMTIAHNCKLLTAVQQIDHINTIS